MLVLARVELFFLVVASMGLCFGFVLEVLVIAEQYLNRVMACSASHPTPPTSRLGVHKKLRGNTAGTADSNWPKGYSMPYDILLSI